MQRSFADDARSYASPPEGLVFTVGHGARPGAELVETLVAAGVGTVVDVRRFPGSRRHPQFNQRTLAAVLEEAGIRYRHAVELGGRRSDEPGEERFACVTTPAFRSYAARMGRAEFATVLEHALAEQAPCFMCAETLPWRCHRWLIAELLTARGHAVVHLLRPGDSRPHEPWPEAEARDGRLYLCGQLVA
jgi:uncharacterized protein (DUF488 family)